MKSFEKLCERLVKMEELRTTPVDVESFNNSLQESNSAEEVYEKYTQSSVFEEFSYDSNYPELYPVPRSYANYSSEGPRGYEDVIEPPLRAAVLSLKGKKKALPLSGAGELKPLLQVEEEGARLAKFLNVSLEGLK